MLESFDTRWQQQRAPSRASRRQIWNMKDRVCTTETKWSKLELRVEHLTTGGDSVLLWSAG